MNRDNICVQDWIDALPTEGFLVSLLTSLINFFWTSNIHMKMSSQVDLFLLDNRSAHKTNYMIIHDLTTKSENVVKQEKGNVIKKG